MIYATADLHGNLPEAPRDAELLLIAGDICPDYSDRYFALDTSGCQQSEWLNHEWRGWLAGAPCPVVVTWGNHDYVGEHPHLVPDLPWTLLIDDEITVETSKGSLRVWGTPWVPRLPRWAFYAREEALQARSELIPQGLDILMTHGPPYGAGDFVPYNEKYGNKYGTPPEGEHAGDSTLNDAIAQKKPKAVICGHIHEARGTYLRADTKVYNVAAVDERYRLRLNPWVPIEL